MDVVYKITSPKGKSYIGRTNSFVDRMREHKHEANKLRRDYPLYRAIRRYGWDNFTKEILVEATSEEIEALELHYIKKYDTVKNGYNATYNTEGGGNLWLGREGTKEHLDFIEKMTKINSGENNGMFGKKHSNDSIQLLREKAKGRFSLPWFIDRHGEEEGTKLYNERCAKLKNRKLKKDSSGRFVKE